MSHGLKRYYGQGNLHFVTFSCYRRLPFLRTEYARNVVVKELAKVRSQCGLRLIGYVVMPNHVHLLMSEPVKGTPSTVLQLLKQRISRIMRKPEKSSGAVEQQESQIPCDEDVPAFWQERFYDFNVYSGGKVKEKLNYMHANPVIRKLVQHPKDWPWSSWSFYQKGEAGLIEIDSWEN